VIVTYTCAATFLSFRFLEEKNVFWSNQTSQIFQTFKFHLISFPYAENLGRAQGGRLHSGRGGPKESAATAVALGREDKASGGRQKVVLLLKSMKWKVINVMIKKNFLPVFAKIDYSIGF
jgi:hypothetical protein